MKLTLFADGGARGNPGPAAGGAVLLDEGGSVVAELGRFLGKATNNVAEYTGLIIGLEEALRRGADAVDVRMDSLLVVQQLKGVWKIRHSGLKPLAQRAQDLLAQFRGWSIEHVPRDGNALADAQVNRAIDDALDAAGP
ncbi:MAG: ribonuclease HI family protein [Chloroflexi bacterium]|nr:ribonuclease HI family protein [Chloroflexota bacterium]